MFYKNFIYRLAREVFTRLTMFGLAHCTALLLGFGLQLGLSGGVGAMTVEVHGNQVFASGPVTDDFQRFQEAFAKPEVDTVVFVNSPGGDLWTGLVVGRLIADKKLKTVVAGACVSACSIMFMGGAERTFSDAFSPALTLVGIHGAHDSRTQSIDPARQPQIFAFYKHHIGEKFNAEVMNKALYAMDDAGALLRVFDAARSPKRAPYHCKSFQSLRSTCETFPEVDALSLGIVTSNTLTSLVLPVAFRVMPSVMATPLTKLLGDPVGFYRDVNPDQCADERCRQLTTNFNRLQEHKAVAKAVTGAGSGISGNRDSPDNALLSAVYICNHPRGLQARLCEGHAVNAFDVRDIYSEAAASHAQALQSLQAPAEKFYANEEFGGGFTSAQSLRSSQYFDITPQKLEGVTVVGTQELATQMKRPNAPVVIDVLTGGVEALPGALTLRNGGLAFENPQVDAAYEARFAGLLKLLAPDMAKPVVFYCAGRNLWLSVNAALRAKKLGYSQVAWYRGGLESWKVAALPTAKVLLRAVVQEQQAGRPAPDAPRPGGQGAAPNQRPTRP